MTDEIEEAICDSPAKAAEMTEVTRNTNDSKIAPALSNSILGRRSNRANSAVLTSCRTWLTSPGKPKRSS